MKSCSCHFDQVLEPVATFSSIAKLLGLRRGFDAANAYTQVQQVSPLPLVWLPGSRRLEAESNEESFIQVQAPHSKQVLRESHAYMLGGSDAIVCCVIQTTRHSPYKHTSHTFDVEASSKRSKLSKWRDSLTSQAKLDIERLIRDAFPRDSLFSAHYRLSDSD